MKNKDLDNFFKFRSNSFNEMPSDDLWKKIQTNLSQEPKLKSNFKKPFLIMALPIITLITIASLYINNNNSIKSNKTILNNDTIKKAKTLTVSNPNILLKPQPKTLNSKKIIPTKTSINTKNTTSQTIQVNDIQISETSNIQEKIYDMNEVHIKPEYPGSINKLYTLISKKFKTPKECPGGRITLTFVIEKNGTLTDIKTIKDIGYGTGTEAERVLKESHKWEPGKQDGKIVRVQYILPITIQPIENTEDEGLVFSMAGINVQPEFIGGEEKLYEFINQNYRIPEACPGGKIYIGFIIEKDGSLSNFKIVKDIGYNTGEEAIRVLKKCPKWEPGEQNGKKIRVYNMIPITIRSKI